jgi:hypothetical protein
VALDLKGDYAAAREHLQKAIDVAPADQKNRALRVMAFSYAFEIDATEAEKYGKQVFDALMRSRTSRRRPEWPTNWRASSSSRAISSTTRCNGKCSWRSVSSSRALKWPPRIPR